jgi:hypothetical protein
MGLSWAACVLPPFSLGCYRRISVAYFLLPNHPIDDER